MSTEMLIESLCGALKQHASLCEGNANPAQIVGAVQKVREAAQEYAEWLMEFTGWSAPIAVKAQSAFSDDADGLAGAVEPRAEQQMSSHSVGPKVVARDLFMAEVRYCLTVTDPAALGSQLGTSRKVDVPRAEAELLRMFRENAWRPEIRGISIDDVAVDVWLEEP